jgi:3'-5' exonuclease
MRLVFDLETLPTTDPEQIADIHAKVKPPANYKKAETIATWLKEEGEAAKADAVARTALDGTYGRIAVIGYAFDDEPARAIYTMDERTTIDLFFLDVSNRLRNIHYDKEVKPVTVIGHNITGFDIPFLRKRCMVHGIHRPVWMPWYDRYNVRQLFDTLLAWDSDREKRISLDRLCKVFNVPTSKDGMDGSMVGKAWEEGRFQEVADYCIKDVNATRECYRRMI